MKFRELVQKLISSREVERGRRCGRQPTDPMPWVEKPDIEDIVIEDHTGYVIFRCQSGASTNQQLLSPQRRAAIKLVVHYHNNFYKALKALKDARSCMQYHGLYGDAQSIETTINKLEEVEE